MRRTVKLRTAAELAEARREVEARQKETERGPRAHPGPAEQALVQTIGTDGSRLSSASRRRPTYPGVK